MAKRLINNFKSLKARKVRPDLFGGLNNSGGVVRKPQFNATDGEKVIYGKSNVRIVLGKDRPGDASTGYGGRGDLGCGTIDFVVEPVKGLYQEGGEEKYCEPSFQYDAARIYLSGRTDIDENFGIKNANKDMPARSAVAIFGDCSRVFAREDIKLVSGLYPENAAGGAINKIGKIQLVGMNRSELLQPAVLGGNMVDFCESLIDAFEQFVRVFDDYVSIQGEFNNTMSTHYHYSPFMGNPTTPSEQAVLGQAVAMTRIIASTKSSIVSMKLGLANFKMKYLAPVGEKNIKSHYVEIN